MRVVTDRKSAEKHIRRMEGIHPLTGSIRVLKLTERQFHAMNVLTVDPDPQELLVGANEIVML